MNGGARSVVFAIVLLCVVCGLNCSDEVVVAPYSPYKPPNDVRDIVPLALGNRWDYRCVSVSCFGRDTTLGSESITDTFHLSDTVYYVYQSSCESVFREEFYGTTDSMGYTRFFGGGFRSYLPIWPVRLLEAPVERGHEWIAAAWDTMYQYQTFGVFRITAVDSTIVVAGRTYKHSICVQRVDCDESCRRYFFVPGIGIVKEELFGGLGGGWIELIDKNF